MSCETCGPNGWQCEPTPSCTNSCGGMVCAECPVDDDGPGLFGGCQCACNGGSYTCELAEGCCNSDIDCGDESFVPCVNNVCKQPVDDGCWSDLECSFGQTCVGATVCPCGSFCFLEDMPGACQNG